MVLYIINFNNYSNRLYKALDDLSEITDPIYYESNNLNFNPGNGVYTSYIAGRQGNPYDGSGNYLVYSEDNENITSKWFILEQNRNLKGQYTLSLKRDVVGEYYKSIITSPAYIKKGIIADGSPLMFNKEGLSVNEVKTNTYPLYDASKCPWVVMYLPVETPAADQEYTLKYVNHGGADFEYDSEDAMKAVFDTSKIYFKTTSNEIKFITSLRDFVKSSSSGNTYNVTQYYSYINTSGTLTTENYRTYQSVMGSTSHAFADGITNTVDNLSQYTSAITSSIGNYLKSYSSLYSAYAVDSSSTYESMYANNNKIIKVKQTDDTYKYYKVKTTISEVSDNIILSSASNNKQDDYLWTAIRDKLREVNNQTTPISTDNLYWNSKYNNISFNLLVSAKSIKYTLTEISNPAYIDTATVKFTSSNLTAKPGDAPYRILAFPYVDGTVFWGSKVNYYAYKCNYKKEKTLGFIQSLAEQIGSSNVYDIQLIPYCPFISNKYFLGIGSYNEICIKKNKDICVYGSNDSETNPTYDFVGMFVTEYSGTINIDGPDYRFKLSKKMEYECCHYRLASPSYASYYDFSPGMLGDATGFNVTYTLMPYQSFFCVKPNYSFLYGNNFNDARGLVLTDNMSIAYTSSAWAEYINSNKNYMNIFKREVQGIELEQGIQRQEQNFAALSGLVSAVSNGVSNGAKVGSVVGPVGTAIGAVVGGIGGGLVSGYGASLDWSNLITRQNEQLSIKKDMFNYSIENIQAQPDTLKATTGINEINQMVPIIECYTCSDIEKNVVADNIIWKGMSVCTSSTIGSFIINNFEYNGKTDKGYIEAGIMRLPNYIDNEVSNEIISEIYKGWYFKE